MLLNNEEIQTDSFGFFCKYCGNRSQSMLKNEDTCCNCFVIDEKGKVKPQYNSKTGEKYQIMDLI